MYRVIYTPAKLPMSVRPTIQIGHPALKSHNKPIRSFKSKKLNQLIADLRDTMRAEELIGMAAPQIAENFFVFVTEPRKTTSRKLARSDKFRVYINPIIKFFSKDESLFYEGCGSVLHGELFGPVKRSQIIEVEAFDEHGRKFRLRCDGILARVIQHEMDHLHGIEFLERVSDYKQLMTREYYRERIRNSNEQIEASAITVLEYQQM